jgi:O-antigen/teichoic acid export membrane protein
MTTSKALQLFQLLRQGTLILVSIILAKSHLQTAEIGIYEVLLYVGTVLTFFWINGLLQAMTPVYSKLGEEEKSPFIFNQFLVFCGLSLGLFVLLILGEKWLIPILTGLPQVPYFWPFCGYLLFHIPTFSVEYLYLLRNQPKKIVVWGVASSALQLLAIALPLGLGFGLEAAIYGLLLVAILKFFWTLLFIIKHGKWTYRSDLLQRYLRFAAPLMVSVLAGNFILLFDNWLVGWWYKDEAIFAVYRFGAREFPVVSAMATALGVSLIPSLSKQIDEGMANQKAMSRKLFHLLFPLSIVLLFLSKPMFPIVFNPQFAESAGIFNIYLLLVASRVLLPNSIVLAEGAPKVIFKVGMLELLLKIILGFVFIQIWGLAGVAWSTVLCFWFEKIALIWYLTYKKGISTEKWLDIRVYLGYCGLLFLGYFVASAL